MARKTPSYSATFKYNGEVEDATVWADVTIESDESGRWDEVDVERLVVHVFNPATNTYIDTEVDFDSLDTATQEQIQEQVADEAADNEQSRRDAADDAAYEAMKDRRMFGDD